MKVELTLETVSPLFLGGAEQQPELRPASVRGALRFWLRAALGGVLGSANLEALRLRETEVFGATDYGSPVIARLSGREQAQPFNPDTNLTGLRYLLFSMHRLRRSCLPAGSLLTVTLQARAGREAVLLRAAEALWLLARVGSLGARSRRGAGSLQAAQVSAWPTSLPPVTTQAATVETLAEELGSGLRQIRRNVAAWTHTETPVAEVEPGFDTLQPDACRLYLLREPQKTWEAALDRIGQEFLDFRTSVSGLPSAKRAIFGLPLPFYYRDERRTYTISPATTDRRASPLAIRLVKLANGGGYVVLLALFRSRFLPLGERLRVNGGISLRDEPPSYEVIDDFLNSLSKLEVNYR